MFRDGDCKQVLGSACTYGTILLFLEVNKLRYPDVIYPRGFTHKVVGSRVDVVMLRDQMARVSRFSCRFFTAMAGNENQGTYT